MLRQSVVWTPKTGTNDRGEATYGPPVAVAARKLVKSRDIIGKDGEVVTATNQVTMLPEPTMGDLLDGREVVAITGLTDYLGNTVAFTALTR